MKVAKDVRDYAAALGLDENAALDKRVETMSVEFVQAGAEVCRKI